MKRLPWVAPFMRTLCRALRDRRWSDVRLLAQRLDQWCCEVQRREAIIALKLEAIDALPDNDNEQHAVH